MLGLIGRNRPWHWAAMGKHPAAADYINIQGGTPLMTAVADWVTKGYEELQRGRPSSNCYYSWRFWLRSIQKGSLICGLGRDSSDRIGRPFPLLIMGEGPLKGWEKQWTSLPMALSRVWGRMERIAAHRYDDLKSLVGDLEQLSPPRIEDMNGHAHATDVNRAIHEQRLGNCRLELEQNGKVLIPLNETPAPDIDAVAVEWHGQLQRCCSEIPRAVFLGGTDRGAYMSVIRHPLSTSDFVQLWSVG